MRIAIAGCGQLARMMALAGLPLGLKFSFIADGGEQTDTRCVDGLGIIAPWQPGQPGQPLYEQLGQPDVVTVEKEQVDLELLRALQPYSKVFPSPEAVAYCQHRHSEKQLLEQLNIPAAPYGYKQPLETSIGQLGYPVVIKSVDEGYDGKNQWVLRNSDDLRAFKEHGDDGVSGNYLVEAWIPFDKEVSLIAVRSSTGQIRHYPLTENKHSNGILVHSIAPATHIQPETLANACDYIDRLLEEMDYVGVLAMECFVSGDSIMVNELAPRVHNSGHWTQMGSVTCQFENHVRAISGLPLGSTSSHGVAGMVNLLGVGEPPFSALTCQSSLHWYNKIPRPGRKLGHVNFLASDLEELKRQMDAFQGTKSDATG